MKEYLINNSFRYGFYFVFATLLSCSSYEQTNEEVVVSAMRSSLSDAADLAMPKVAFESPAKNKPDKTWRAAGAQGNSAVLSIGDDVNIAPKAVDIKIQVDGFRARIVVDGVYINPHNRTLEGDFKFRLPDGAKPYYFAFGEALQLDQNMLDNETHISKETLTNAYLSADSLGKKYQGLWKEPKEAVMVSRQKAAFAYEDTVSRQIDPALLEWSGAGIFSASVYPLMPKSLNRIVIGYDIDLQRFGDDLYLDLPLVKESIEKQVHITFGHLVPEAVQMRRVIGGDIKSPFSPSVINGVLQETLQGEMLNGVRIKIDAEYSPALIGMDEVGEYFATQWLAELPKASVRNGQRAVFVLDTSLSASEDKFHLWVTLLLETLSQNESDLQEFALVSFNTGTQWWKQEFVINNKENRNDLEGYLYSLILEGATDLSHALESATDISWLDKKLSYDLFLYSDGAATWGERNVWAISEGLKSNFNGKVFSYRLGLEGEDKAFLDHLVRELGGTNFHLQDKNEINALATAHKLLAWSIESIELEGVHDILLEGRPNTIYPGQVLTVVGRKVGDLGKALSFSLKNADQVIQIEIPIKRVLPSTLTARTYGEIAVTQLESLGELKEKVAAAYANHFKVPGQASSLLMLETKDDYDRYNISPKQDAYVVKTTSIAEVFSSISGNISAELSYPKGQFMAYVKKLTGLKSVSLDLPHAVTLLMERLPDEAFIKPREVLNYKVALKKQSNTSYIGGLAKEKIYNLVVDESERRLKKYGPADAIKVMSNLVERAPADVTVLRDVAYAADVWGQPLAAYELHLRALDIRPFEPQSYSYLANLAEKIGMHDLALLYFEMGLAGEWGNRFEDYEIIHRMDYLSFIERRILDKEQDFHSSDYARIRLKNLKKEFPVSLDLLVIVSWNTDRTDVDLHVVEPSGEECYYKHKMTRSKGEISGDVTGGYGPEFYKNGKAPKGVFKIYTKYFADDQNKMGLKTKVNVRVIENWGTPNHTENSVNVALKKEKHKQFVYKIEIN